MIDLWVINCLYKGGFIMLEKIQQLIKQKKDLNQPDENGELLLHQAVRTQNLPAVSLLIEAGVDINQKDEMDISALMQAAWRGSDDILKLLIQKGALVDEQNKMGYTPLICATFQGNAKSVELLLQENADVKKTNYEGETALLLAVKNNDLSIVSKLLEANADIHHQNNNGMDSLMLASLLGYKEMAHLLLEKGADTSHADKEGNTALMVASSQGNLDMVRLLVEKGANMSQTNKKGLKPAEIAVEHSHFDILNYFIDVMGEDVLDQKYKKLPKRFLNAVVSGNLEMVQAMIESGIDVNASDTKGVTPLMAASFKGHEKLVQYFIDYGADLTQKSKEGLTAMDYAIQKEKYEIARIIKKAIENEQKNPRIFSIIEKGNVHHLERFIEHGFNVNMVNEEGDSPLMKAIGKADLEMAKILLSAGADMKIQNKKGEGILHQIEKSNALTFKKVQMVALLKEFGFPVNQELQNPKRTMYDVILSETKEKEEKKMLQKLLASLGIKGAQSAKKSQTNDRD